MATTDRRSSHDGHLLIAGTGRAGTTLLVQYFTALGFDTGFTLEQALDRVDPISNAGLEQSVRRTLAQGRPLAYVAKSPYFGANLDDYLASGALRVKACIVPVRELFSAAESRRSVSRAATEAGVSADGAHPGGLVRPKRAGKRQEEHLAVAFHQLVHTMLSHDVPLHFLRFPEFARGEQDLFLALGPLLAEHGVTREEHDAAFARVVRPDLISDFPRD